MVHRLSDDLANELATANKRIADLEARVANLDRSERVQAALYRIAETASTAADMPSFYAAMHEIVGELMYADNFYIALYDEARQRINYPFFRDEVDSDIPDPNTWEPFGTGNAKGATAYVLRTSRSQWWNEEQFTEMAAAGEIEIVGAPSVEWMGVPLMADGRSIGVVAVQTYRDDRRYAPGDLELLTFVGHHIGTALTRARAIEETRQRNEELALVNEVGLALAKQLDFGAIIDLIGDRIRSIFEVDSVSIALHDPQTNLVSFPYFLERGQRVEVEGWELGPGLTSQVITSGVPLRLNTLEEARGRGAIVVGLPEDEAPASESWLGVPIMASGRVMGIVNLDRPEPFGFSESDERLLGTLAASMGVALENARLFDETKRLLTETDERASELAIINEIGEALAKQLDFDAIIELVGERIGQLFTARTLDIGLHDPATGMINFPFSTLDGAPAPADPIPLGDGLTSRIITTMRPLRIGSSDQADELGAVWRPDEDRTESYLGVPILTGDRAIGTIALIAAESDAYSEADERLLSTFASSMGVALENVRLFDETKRLLTETDERAAELAIINSVQEGLAQNLDMQAMYDLVGDKIQEIFDAQVVDIGILDFEAGLVRYPYVIERGVRFPDDPTPIADSSLTKLVLESRQPALVNDIPEWDKARGQALQVNQGEPSLSALVAPLMVSGDVRGRISLQNLDRTDAFTEADIRLLSTLASSLSVALENARLFDETKRLLTETDERAAELAIINSVQEGLAQNLDMQAMYDLVGDKIQEIFDAQVADIGIYDTAAGTISYPYSIERGESLPNETIPIADSAMSTTVLETRQPLYIRDAVAWQQESGAAQHIQGEVALSVLMAPMIVGGEVRGRISIQNLDRVNAFSDSDVRLLSTLAASLSVALENARLFDETKRLLTETDERAAELAVVNSVQEGLAQNLDMQAMYELVGEKIQEIFEAQVVDIGIVDRRTDVIRFPYTIERGVRFPDEPVPIFGIRKHVLETREPLVINERAMERSVELGQPAAIQGETPKSYLFAPLIIGDEARGVISLQNLDREGAFAESDVRLLTTLASSLSVALENARLFDETRRLLTETDERAAELAIINSVQEGLAAEPRHAVDVRPGRRQDRRDLRRPDRADQHVRLHLRNDVVPLRDRARGAPRQPGAAVQRVRTPAHDREASARHQRGSRRLAGRPRRGCRHRGRTPEVDGLRPARRRRPGQGFDFAPERRPRARLHRRERPPAHNARIEPERRARERAALRRDEAPARGNRPPRRRACDHEQRPAPPGVGARHPGDVRAGRGAGAGRLRRAGRRHLDLRPRGGCHALAVHHRARRAVRGRAAPAHRLPEEGHRDGRPDPGDGGLRGARGRGGTASGDRR